MASLDQEVEDINSKLHQLLKNHALLQKESKRFQKENEQLRLQLIAKSEQVDILKNKLDAANFNASSPNLDLKKDMEKRITTYLKEIDKCLALLNA